MGNGWARLGVLASVLSGAEAFLFGFRTSNCTADHFNARGDAVASDARP
jgi:hypothetical protein